VAQVVGKYELGGLIGKGSSGSVYRAVDSFSGDEIALKIIDPAVFTHPEFGTVYRKQFLNEASLAGQLSHPHIVTILDAVVGEDAGHIAMEYVAGGNLSRYTRAGSLLGVADAIEVGFKCCGALDYAYRKGIVHRDIKPGNIMVVDGTEIKICDFGSAYLRMSDLTQAMNVGTPAYMSPEQIKGNPLTYGSDMYCLGVVLYELLTGQRPFDADNINSLVLKVINGNAPPPSAVRPELPPELDAVVLRAMSRDPADRYPSWAEFALELARIGRLSVYEKSIPDSAKFEAAKGVKVFALLSDAELWEFIRVGRWSRLPPQQRIVSEGEAGQSLFFLASGSAKVTKEGRLLNLLSGGECFGEMAYIRGGDIVRHATVESVTDVVVAEFEAAALDRVSDACQKHLMRALVSNLVDRLALADERIAQALRQSN
jgi:serine/threonine protein kinase